jgi:hypothetical protein
MKVLIKSQDATYTIYWISGYKEIRIGVLQGHSFNNIAVLLAGAPLRRKWLIYTYNIKYFTHTLSTKGKLLPNCQHLE